MPYGRACWFEDLEKRRTAQTHSLITGAEAPRLPRFTAIAAAINVTALHMGRTVYNKVSANGATQQQLEVPRVSLLAVSVSLLFHLQPVSASSQQHPQPGVILCQYP